MRGLGALVALLLNALNKAFDPRHAGLYGPACLLDRQFRHLGASWSVTEGIPNRGEEALQRFALPVLDKGAVLLATQIVDVAMCTLLTAVRPAFLVRDNLDGAFKRPCRVEGWIPIVGVTPVQRFLHVDVYVLPEGVRHDRPERSLDLLFNQLVSRDLDEAIVVVESCACKADKLVLKESLNAFKPSARLPGRRSPRAGDLQRLRQG